MPSHTFIKKDNTKTRLRLLSAPDGIKKPSVVIDGQHYQSMASLVAAHPDALTDLSLCCTLLLHFHRGAGFLPITDPEEYRARYAKLLLNAENDGEFVTAGDFDVFDVSEITHPAIHASKLVFYAEDLRYNLPYRIESPWPVKEKQQVEYLLLPLHA